MAIEGVIARRRTERAVLIERARVFVQRISRTMPLRGAIVIGSVARGDFNRWSDVDLLLIADGLDPNPLRRVEQLGDRPALVQPIIWTTAEWVTQVARHNPMAREALEFGEWLQGSPQALT